MNLHCSNRVRAHYILRLFVCKFILLFFFCNIVFFSRAGRMCAGLSHRKTEKKIIHTSVITIIMDERILFVVVILLRAMPVCRTRIDSNDDDDDVKHITVAAMNTILLLLLYSILYILTIMR